MIRYNCSSKSKRRISMNKNRPPQDLVLDLTRRGEHRVFMMAAVIVDPRGYIFSWGWNHNLERPVDGSSAHAEVHAIRRANRSRLGGATIYVAGRRRGTNRILFSKPCSDCERRIRKTGITMIVYSNPDSPTGWSTLQSKFI